VLHDLGLGVLVVVKQGDDLLFQLNNPQSISEVLFSSTGVALFNGRSDKPIFRVDKEVSLEHRDEIIWDTSSCPDVLSTDQHDSRLLLYVTLDVFQIHLFDALNHSGDGFCVVGLSFSSSSDSLLKSSFQHRLGIALKALFLEGGVTD